MATTTRTIKPRNQSMGRREVIREAEATCVELRSSAGELYRVRGARRQEKKITPLKGEVRWRMGSTHTCCPPSSPNPPLEGEGAFYMHYDVSPRSRCLPGLRAEEHREQSR